MIKKGLKIPYYKVWYSAKPRTSNPLPPGLAFFRRTLFFYLSILSSAHDDVNIFIFTRYSDIFHSTYNVCTVFWKSDSDKIFYPLWRQRCISKLLQWAARAFSAFCKRPILKYRERWLVKCLHREVVEKTLPACWTFQKVVDVTLDTDRYPWSLIIHLIIISFSQKQPSLLVQS